MNEILKIVQDWYLAGDRNIRLLKAVLISITGLCFLLLLFCILLSGGHAPRDVVAGDAQHAPTGTNTDLQLPNYSGRGG